MKKLIVIILSAFFLSALFTWFSCNPFNNHRLNSDSESAILDELDGTRLVLYCTIQINGSTFDAGGESYDASNLVSMSEALYPTFAITNGTLKNAILLKPTVEGIYLSGGVSTVDNVTALDIADDIVTVKKTGTYVISSCTFNNGEDKVIQINDMCTITTQSVKSDTCAKFIRQNGAKTWKMTSYSNDCTIMNLKECVFRSDSQVSTFFYRNLTTNCSAIGYPAREGISYTINDDGTTTETRYIIPGTKAVPY